MDNAQVKLVDMLISEGKNPQEVMKFLNNAAGGMVVTDQEVSDYFNSRKKKEDSEVLGATEPEVALPEGSEESSVSTPESSEDKGVNIGFDPVLSPGENEGLNAYRNYLLDTHASEKDDEGRPIIGGYNISDEENIKGRFGFDAFSWAVENGVLGEGTKLEEASFTLENIEKANQAFVEHLKSNYSDYTPGKDKLDDYIAGSIYYDIAGDLGAISRDPNLKPSEKKEKTGEYLDRYVNAFIETLPEDQRTEEVLEGVSEVMYDRFGFRMNFDGDNVYNEDVFGAVGIVGGAAATTLDMISGPLSVVAAPFVWIARNLDDDPSNNNFFNAVTDVDQGFANASEYVRRNMTRDYQDVSFFDSTKSTSVAHHIGRMAQTLGEVAPYAVAAAGSPTVLAAGVNVGGGITLGSSAFINNLVDGYREDQIAISEGQNPVYSNTASGALGRVVEAIGVGVLEGFSGVLMQGAMGRMTGGRGIHDTFRKLFVTEGQAATRTQLAKAYLMAQGVEMPLEAVEEFSVTLYEGWIETAMGDSEKDFDLIWEESLNAAEVGAMGSAGMGAVSSTVGVARGEDSTPATPRMSSSNEDLVNQVNAAANSPADEARYGAFWFGLDSESENSREMSALMGGSPFDLQEGDRYSTANSARYQESVEAHKKTNKDKYAALILRKPKDWRKLQSIDRRITRVLAEGTAAQSKTEQENLDERAKERARSKVERLKKEYMDLVKQRREIFSTFEFDGNLTQEEGVRMDDSQVSQRINEIDQEIRGAQSEVDAYNEVEGTVDADPIRRRSAEQRVQDLEQTRETANQSARDVDEARENLEQLQSRGASAQQIMEAAEILASTEQELADLLDLNTREIGKKRLEERPAPMPILNWSAVDQAANHFEDAENKGSTFTLDGVNQAGRPMASVSIFNERSEIVEGDMTQEELSKKLDEFKEKNKDILDGNEDVLSIGTYYSPESNQTFIDISAVVDKGSAEQLGKEYNQESVWDLEFMNSIPTGGDGRALDNPKTEAERINDIRSIVGANRKQTEESRRQSLVNRGIDGQFDDYSADSDGNFNIKAQPHLSQEQADFINKRVAKTLANYKGGKVTIRMHQTEESGNMADGRGDKVLFGHQVTYKDGEVVIHMNPAAIARKAEQTGKTFESVMMEEVLHAVFGPGVRKLFKDNPKKARQVLRELDAITNRISKENPEVKNLSDAVESKKRLYNLVRETEGKTREEIDTEVFEEAVFEYLSTLAPFFDSSVLNQKNESAILKVVNDILRALGIPVINDSSLAVDLLSRVADTYQKGDALEFDGKEGVPTEGERSSMSPGKRSPRVVRVQSLPQDEKFTVRYLQPVYGRGEAVGIRIDGRLADMEFNGKFHFINWWKRTTRNGAGADHYGAWEVSMDGGKTFRPLDADAMKRWKMKPLKKRETERERSLRLWQERKELNNKAYQMLRDHFGLEWGLYKTKQKFFKEVMPTFLDEEALAKITGHEGEIDPGGLTNEQMVEYIAAIEVAIGIRPENSGSDIVSENSNMFLFNAAEVMKIQDRNERVAKMKKLLSLYKCGGSTNECDLRGDKAYLATYMEMIKDALGGDFSDRNAAELISGMVQFQDDLRISRGQRSIKDINKETQELNDRVSDMLGKQHGENGGVIPKNHRDFQPLFTTILAITSNGNRTFPNLKIAISLFDAALKRLEGGATMKEALNETILEGIEKYNPEITGGNVRGGRGGTVAQQLRDILAFADQYYNQETGEFDGKAFASKLGRKKYGKEGVQASKIIGKGPEGNAMKLGEFAAGLLGYGTEAYLPNELWVNRGMSALQGNFDLNVDDESGLLILDYGFVPTVQEFLDTYNVTEEQSREALRETGKEAKDEADLAIGGLLHFKKRKDISKSQRASASNYLNRLIGRDPVVSPKSDYDRTRRIIKLATESLNETVGKGKKKWTPFAVQQAFWETSQETLGFFEDGQYNPVDYLTRLDEIEDAGDWMQIDDVVLDPGVSWSVQANQNSKEVSEERSSMQLDLFGNTQSELEVMAHESNLWRSRGVAESATIRTQGGQEPLSDDAVQEALQTDATSIRIMSEENEVKDGDIVAVRLNLNVKKNTGVPVQTIHHRTASGKALQYAGAVTLRNVTLDVNQDAREKIVTFRENKFPMAAVRGEFVSKGIDGSNLDGVKATFNPFREHLFTDAAGRPIKSAEEATVIGNVVILRGKIEYYDPASDIAQRGKKETDANKAARLDKGSPKYKGNLRRFKAFSERALGVTYNTEEELEQAYALLPVSSKVALSESEVAENMATADERASIAEWTKGKRMRATAKSTAYRMGGTVREEIIKNPVNFIKPQKINEIKEDLTAYTDGELVSFMTDDSIGRLSQRNDDIGVLAGAELLNRAIARGETERIPAIVAELAAMGTTAGRILRHFRELKSSSPRGLYQIIEAAVTDKGNSLTDTQKERLKGLTEKLFEQQAKVDELMKRGIGGENVDAEFDQALKEMQVTERELDTFVNAVIEKDWGTIFKQLVQGNLLTPFSQIVNVGANMVNAFGKVAVDTISLPFEAAIVKVGNIMGKNLQMRRRPSLSAYMYAMRRFGSGFIEACDQIVTGQDKEISEWRINRGFAPLRSIMAVWGGDLPLGPDGKGSPTQKAKLIIQGTLGVPAETMFRFLSLGDIPFRRWAEAKELYQIGISRGLEGEALERFLKFPNKKDLDIARREGRKLTFQEEGFVSQQTNRAVSTMEGMLSKGLEMIPGINDGSKFSRALFGVILPYRSTPANILQETFTWINPYVGIVRMANDISKGDVEEASKTMTKMMLGAVTLEAAMMMIKEGIISGPVEWQDDEKRNMAYDVFPPNCVNVSALERLIRGEDPSHRPDDVFRHYDKMGMFGAIMSTAVQSIDRDDLADIKNREYGGPIEFTSHMIGDFFGASSVSSISAMMEQSFVQGLNQFLQVLIGDNVERDLERFITTAFRAGSAAVLPNTLTSLYKSERAFLPDTRTTKDDSTLERILTKFEYTIKERMFNLSEVPIRVNWKGEDIKQTPPGANGYVYQMFDLTRAQQGSSDPLSNEVWRLYEQTEELANICSTPGYAEKRAVAVPNISSKRDKKLVAALPKTYTWMQDEEFMADRVYLNTEQMNRLMKISGRNRYEMSMEVIQSQEYQSANDQDKLAMLEDVANEFNSAKEYTDGGFEPHTIELFNIMQDIYDGRR